MRYSPQPVIRIVLCCLNYAIIMCLNDFLALVLPNLDKKSESLIVEHVALITFFFIKLRFHRKFENTGLCKPLSLVYDMIYLNVTLAFMRENQSMEET